MWTTHNSPFDALLFLAETFPSSTKDGFESTPIPPEGACQVNRMAAVSKESEVSNVTSWSVIRAMEINIISSVHVREAR